jgi:hypothetical protein
MKDFRKQYKDGKNEEGKYWRIFNRNQNADFIQSGDVRNGKIRIRKTIRYLKNKIKPVQYFWPDVQCIYLLTGADQIS